ncbi:hypothetical protein G9A89_016351 [Geosiphon pyriformis]|nr:hypothetical protein G9A89_016351 [Geosiphon pyriformis]
MLRNLSKLRSYSQIQLHKNNTRSQSLSFFTSTRQLLNKNHNSKTSLGPHVARTTLISPLALKAQQSPPTIWKPVIFAVVTSTTIFSVAVVVEERRRESLKRRLQRWTNKWDLSVHDWHRYRAWLAEYSLARQVKRLESLGVPKEIQRIWTLIFKKWHYLSDSQKTMGGIIIVNAIVYGMWQLKSLHPLMNRYFLHNPLSGRSLTLLTSVFSHHAFWHLGLNMMALYSLGSVVHNSMGREQFLAFYITSGIWSSLVSHILSLKFSPLARIIPSLGASGAIFACLSSCAISWGLSEDGRFSIIMHIWLAHRLVSYIQSMAMNIYGSHCMPASFPNRS